jgi:sulfate permease, SulP family
VPLPARFRVGRRRTLREDSTAGLVLGVESVPDGLATGLLAGVNPVSGLYAYMFGMAAGALATSSAFMAVQGTGAMAILVADVGAVHGAEDAGRALFTLSVLTGTVMLVVGLLRLGTVLRFVSNAVMVGFINAVGVNIVLGQLGNFTGYSASGANRVMRALDTVLHPGRLDPATVAVGVTTVAFILALERTRIGALGMVVAMALTSGVVALIGVENVATLSSITDVPRSLPMPVLPDLGLVPVLILPAVSLAFVGLVQGAGISANFPNPDGTYSDASRDFVGQGIGNIVSGAFRGMPVGGSMSATSLARSAGAQSRQALLIAAVVMAVVVVTLGDVVGRIAMPALAGLLILIGVRTVKPADLFSVWRVGSVQATVMVVTFVLTMLIPLQYAVVVGVGLSVVLYVVRQSNQVTVMERRFEGEHAREIDAPAEVPGGEVLVLQPYGSLFFASASVFEAALPAVTDTSRGAVVIIRLRGRSDLGTTFMDVVRRYALALQAVGSRLVIVSANERIHEQLAVTGVADVVGPDGIYDRDEFVGTALRRAYTDAEEWIRTVERPVEEQ